MTAGGAIFRRLHRLGVDRVFVNSGTDFPPIIEGLAEGEAHGAPLPRSIVVPHEHVAVSMAQASLLQVAPLQILLVPQSVSSLHVLFKQVAPVHTPLAVPQFVSMLHAPVTHLFSTHVPPVPH